jgi:hypothetical protein
VSLTQGLATEHYTGVLTINSITLDGPWIRFRDLVPLWYPAPNRINNRAIARAAGDRPKKYRRGSGKYSLPFDIVGAVLHDGTSAGSTKDDWMAGLEENLAYLEENVVTPPASDATMPAELLMPSGTTRFADVQVEAIVEEDRHGDLVYMTMDLVVPSGRFVEP